MSHVHLTGRAAIAFVVAALAIAGGAGAQTQPDPGEIHGLKLGLAAQAMTLDGWGQLACGSDGGPPRQELDAWSDFTKCRPEASGLREVNARFDDEDEYVAKALGEPAYAGRQTGTRVAASEVMVNTPHVSELIKKGDVIGVKEAIRTGNERGMLSFDQSLYNLVREGRIELEEALSSADSRAASIRVPKRSRSIVSKAALRENQILRSVPNSGAPGTPNQQSRTSRAS